MRKYLILVLFLAVNFIFAQTTFYVSLSGSNSPPYGSLANGANDIQTAVDAASNGDLILVNDGTYVLPSQITITKGVTVRSINGKSYVTIDGDNSVRCVYMNHADAVLDGFAITNGYNPSGFGGAVNIASGGTVQNCVITNSHARDGGGVAIDNNGLVYNCVIANNTADNGSTGFGGGVRMLNGGITRNSLIHSNTSRTYGGGINIWNAGTIQSCTVTNNTAPQGAGVRGRNASTMENSIVYFNNGGEDVQLSGGGQVFNNNCTTNLLLNNYGTNNIVDDPVFGFNPPMMNPFRIASNSPCVDAGINQAWMTGAVDYDGYDRIFNGTVDIGAFEYFLSALDVPELVSPGDPFSNPGTPTDYPVDLDLEWNSVSGAIIYKVQLTLVSDPSFSSPIIDEWAGYGETYYSVTGLDYWTNYLWRVKANNPTTGQESSWTEANVFMTKLAPPLLDSPADETAGVSVNPTLSWNRSTGAMLYGYEIYSDAECTNLVYSGSTTAGPEDSIAVVPIILENSTDYYWKVQAIHPVSSSDFSDVWKFSTIQEAVPSLGWPLDGAQMYSSTVYFNWYMNNYFTNISFDILISTDINFTAPIIIEDITNVFYSTDVLAGGVDYYWRVRTKLNGVISSYSQIESFTTYESNAALNPVPSWPVGSVTVYISEPTLYWYVLGPGSGLTYDIEINTGALSGTPTYTGISSLYKTLTGLTSGTSYNWSVRSYNGSEYSDWSDTQSFSTVVVTSSPVKPIISSPVNGALVYNNTAILSWYIGTYRPGLTYEVEYQAGALTGTANVTGIDGLYLSLTGLSSGTTYNWSVRSTDGSTYSDWSEPESFTTTGSGEVFVPIPSWPIGGNTVYTNNPTLIWYLNGSSVGLTYKLQYADNISMNDPVTISDLPYSTVNLADLESGKTYYWRVKSFDGTVYSAYSAVESFTTFAGSWSVTPVPGSPVDNVDVLTSSPVISWFIQTPSETESYQLQYSLNADMSDAVTISDLSEPYFETGELNSNSTYYWRVKSRSVSGNTSDYSPVSSFITNGVTGLFDKEELPTEFALKQNYPNPFNPSTVIRFQLPSENIAVLKIYDILGNEVITLLNERRDAGTYEVEFNAANLSSGIYFYRLQAGEYSSIMKMILLK